MDKYGLIGYPLGHSFSVGFFNEKFSNENIDAEYINFEIPNIEQLPEIVASNPQLRGLNVTIPYKQKVIPYLDSVSPEARAIGAVNVIKVIHRGKNTLLKGYNSDVIGFTRSIEPLLSNCHGVEFRLEVGRGQRARELGRAEADEIPALVGGNKPLAPAGKAAVPYEALDSHNLLYDLLYNPDETLFMFKGRKQKATVKNGLEMLLLQAFVSWEIWNGK